MSQPTEASSAPEPAAEPPVETTEAENLSTEKESLIHTKMTFPRNLVWHSAQE